MGLLKNRYFHLVIVGIYIALGLWGVIASYVGWLVNIHNEFFVYFTNQSSIIAVICAILFFISALIDIKKGNKETKETRFVTFGLCVFIYQIITMFFYNFFTTKAHIFTVKFWSQIQCPLLHLFCPILFVFIFIAFTDKSKINKFVPLWVLTFPILYAAFIFIRSVILGDVEEFAVSGYIRFPYPIFDYVVYPMWLVITFMILGLLAFSGIAFGLEKLFKRQTKKPVKA